jgi:2-keto-4-pentenoate hydratase/2-oxohepta-3-ene-1,7-dioic acid hydratase in catechol pathway
MAINVLRYEHAGRTGWGVLRGERVTPVPGEFPTTGAFIEANTTAALAALSGGEIGLGDVRVLSPVTRNQQFVCQGANYRQHMIESGMDPDAKHYNMIFTKASSCIVPASSDVVKPRRVRLLDYEIELGLVLRRAIEGPCAVTPDNLADYVAGLVIVNDYSARDVQIPQMQFYKGKSFRTFGPVGPWLCLLEAADYARLGALRLTLTVNGEVRQDDSTANLVYGPAETLAEMSGVHDFAPGDLIATGTPAGCALSIPKPAVLRIVTLFGEAARWRMFGKVQAKRTQYLKAGDLVESRIRSVDGIIDLGVQRNLVVEEPVAPSVHDR